MGIFNRKDDREERKEANNTNANWQEKLEEKGLSSTDRATEMNKNYRSHIGETAKEIKNNRSSNIESDTRDLFTKDELKKETRLEKKQIDNIQNTSNKQETKSELENTRQNKKSWW